MSKILLVAAGTVNGLFALFHIFLGYKIQMSALAAPVRGLIETFNAGTFLILVLLAVVFLARGRDVLRTGLGAALLVFGAAFYLGRVAEEFVWLSGNLVIAGLCMATGLIHLGILPFVKLPANPA